MKSKKYQLKNGLRVLLLESRKSPVISIQMWVKTGSADETKKLEGISHFIEHLVFKGTRKFKVGEIAQIIEGSGGELNAYTSFDQTVFYVTLSKEFSNTGLEAISEMMGFPTFDPQEIDNEREVVIEEIKMGEDSPDRQASQELFRTLYKKHPYGIPVIGYEKNIKEVSVKNLKKYFESRYVPKNMFLIVSGDFETKEMIKDVEKYFADFKPFALKKIKRTKEPAQKSARISTKKTDFQKSVLYMAWKAPSVKHKDVPALDVLGLILGQGDSSRLAIKLRLEKPVVNAIGASSFNPQDPGFFAITMHLEGEKLAEALELTAAEIKNILETVPSAEEMQKAVTNLASEQIYSIETVDGVAKKAGSFEFYTGDHNYFSKYLKQIYALKPEDIQKVAKKYLTAETMSLMLQTNADIKQANVELKNFVQKIKKIVKQSKSAKKFKKEKSVKLKKLTMGAANSQEKVHTETWQHESGIKVVYRQQSETPTVSIRAGFLGGARLDVKGKEGETEMLSRTWTTGSEKYSETDINNAVEGMAAGLSTFGGRNTIGMTTEFLAPFANEMMDLTTDLLRAPLFDKDIVAREKEILIRQIKSKKDHPSAVCMNQFIEALFKDHPYGHDIYGTEESVATVQPEDLKKYYEKVITTHNMTLAVVGDISKKQIQKYVDQLATQLTQKQFQSPKFEIKKLAENKKVSLDMKKEQTHIMLGYQGLSIYDQQRFALHVMQSVLAGQGGRLFVELRDKNSLAYSVSPMRMEGLETGYFGAYIGCSPEKTEKALQMIHAEFDKLKSNLISEEELLRAQRYLIGRHNIDLQRKSSICQSLLLDTIYGIDADETFHVAERYFSVTREDVLNLAQQIFSQKCVTSLVGPQSSNNSIDKSI